jgi:peptidoglycan/xylan/chitin deacetylase (PgdA/CDA1 family)
MFTGNGNGQHHVNGNGHGKTAPLQFYFTIDCDWVPGSHVGLELLLDFCDRHHLKGTIFFAGRFAETYPDLVRNCHDRGHQLGTHGWAHGGLEKDEDFRVASYEQQREWIRRATDAVGKAAGVCPVIFRAPNLRIGEATLRALEDEGYRYDSSVPARRFDMGFGRVHYTEYFWAPLEPYNPSWQRLHRPGGSSILEIPPSACLFPINLAALRVLGLPTFRRMISWIGRRSQHLVFYCHPSEFLYAKDQVFPRAMSKWNQWGMCPANLSILEVLLDYVLKHGYTPTQMMETTVRRLDLGQPIGLKVGNFQSDRIYREGGRR